MSLCPCLAYSITEETVNEDRETLGADKYI